MKKIEKMDVVLTVAWIATIAILILIFIKWGTAKILSLNEWGDFLAGVTAPLAFLWLIIGYMLQRQ